MNGKPNKTSVYRFEVIRHLVYQPSQTVHTPQDLQQYFSFLENYDREYLLRVDLNNAHEMIGYETVGIGTANMVAVGPKEVFRGAMLSGAHCIILIHNHPSGQINPSTEDSQTAERFRPLGDAWELQLLDFIIIGRNGHYYSFSEHDWSTYHATTKAETQAAETP